MLKPKDATTELDAVKSAEPAGLVMQIGQPPGRADSKWIVVLQVLHHSGHL